MKKILILIILFSVMPLFTENTQAKMLPQAKKGLQKSTTVKTAGTGISVFPRLRGDRRALIVDFANLQKAEAVSYVLTYKQSLNSSQNSEYKTSVQDEGAIGSLPLGGSSTATQELLFGTCSKNICRYHTNISSARLEVSYTTKSGSKYIKRFRIRV